MKKNKLNKTERKRSAHRAEKRANRLRKTRAAKQNRRAKFEEARSLYRHNLEKQYEKQTGRAMYSKEIPKKEEAPALIQNSTETK